MAEILLSLTIIGVVAAITLPSLTGNINERTWNTQRKALYARMSQAISLMPALNGYGTLDDTTDTAAETFVTAGLSKVLKINNICDNEHLKDCGIPVNITNIKGNKLINFTDSYDTLIKFNTIFASNSGGYAHIYSQLDTKVAAFETQNGESVLVYYYPYCVTGSVGELIVQYNYTQGNMCANFIYDLNGNKGPNTVGKDIGFISAIYATDPIVVAPMPLSTDAGNVLYAETYAVCKAKDSESRLPNIYELMSLFYNKLLWANSGDLHWANYTYSTDKAWAMYFHSGILLPTEKRNRAIVQCIKN